MVMMRMKSLTGSHQRSVCLLHINVIHVYSISYIGSKGPIITIDDSKAVDNDGIIKISPLHLSHWLPENVKQARLMMLMPSSILVWQFNKMRNQSKTFELARSAHTYIFVEVDH